MSLEFSLTRIESAVVLGAGVMGHGIAQHLAMNRIPVFLVDRSEEFLIRGEKWIRDNLDYLIELGALDESGKDEALGFITFTTELSARQGNADYYLEAVNEDFQLKRSVWKEIARIAPPRAIISSNTSSYDINELSEGVPYPERVIGTHWFHPPQITPCVEVIPSRAAAQSNMDLIMDFLRTLGKMPTPCRSAPGFVANRIQLALAAEAIALVEEGLATPAEVDRIVKTSFGFRLSAYGPFEIMDQAGADTYLSVFKYLYEKLGKSHFKPPALLEKQVRSGRLGLKTSGGFYDYSPREADEIRRERDRRFYKRLDLLKTETEES